MAETVIEAPAGGAACNPIEVGTDKPVYMNGKVVRTREVLEYIRTRRAQTVHSDGFLSLAGVEPTYRCECGFGGFFESKVCDRCGAPVG